MFAILMLAAGAVILTLAFYAWRQGPKPAIRTFALLLVAVAHWLICISGWSLATGATVALMWFWLQFLGVAAVPVLFLSYILQFIGRGAALTPARSLSLWAIPALTQVLAWTNDAHHLMFVDVVFVRRDGITMLDSWVPGPWFLLYSTYSFGLVLIALLLMGRASLGSSNVFRRQLLALLTAILPAVLLTLLNTFQLLPANLLVTPMGFVLTGAAIVWAIVRHQMIAVVPVARDLLIEQMGDGMLVIDERGRVVDLNPAMETLLGQRRDALLSLPFGVAVAHVPGLLEIAGAPDAGPGELELEQGGLPRTYEATVRTLHYRGEPAGRLLVLRDITRLKLAQAELFQLATTDSLTGLLNRRQFFQLATPQVEIAARHRRPLAMLLFDIDHFKQVNDRHGHDVGDQVLIAVAGRARAAVRSIDILCRYGGEEFAILLVDTALADAWPVAERLRESIAAMTVRSGSQTIAVTISIGVAACGPEGPMALAELLSQADAAMYRAKQAGRNQAAYSDVGNDASFTI